jgi:hypothetical protein
MCQHKADRKDAQCMIKVILDTRLINGEHIGGQCPLQTMRAERAQCDTKKRVHRAKRKKYPRH